MKIFCWRCRSCGRVVFRPDGADFVDGVLIPLCCSQRMCIIELSLWSRIKLWVLNLFGKI